MNNIYKNELVYTSRDRFCSIIIPTYNRADLLKRAITSVLAQSYMKFELIVVNDASTDETSSIVKSFNDVRIVYCEHEINKGVTAAETTGFNAAKGDYVALLGDDDELTIDAIEFAINTLNSLSSQGVKIALFDCIDVEQNKISGSWKNTEGYVHYRDYLCGKFSGDYWVMVEKNLLNEVERLNENLWGGEIILWLRLFKKSIAYYTPKTLYKAYREHGKNRMSVFKNRINKAGRISQTHKTFLDEFGDELRLLCPKRYGSYLSVLGFWQIFNGDKSSGRNVLMKSIKYNFSLKSLLLILISFLNKNQIMFFIDFKEFFKRD